MKEERGGRRNEDEYQGWMEGLRHVRGWLGGSIGDLEHLDPNEHSEDGTNCALAGRSIDCGRCCSSFRLGLGSEQGASTVGDVCSNSLKEHW